MTQDDVIEMAREAGIIHPEKVAKHLVDFAHLVAAAEEALAQHDSVQAKPELEQEAVTVLPDGSAFAVMSYPLPKDHWLYQERQYNDGEYEPVELGKPVLTHEMRDAVVSAVRYAIRGATNCGKEVDFDPDALVQNAVYALCGPHTTPPQRTWVGLTDEEYKELHLQIGPVYYYQEYGQAIEAKLKERNT